MTGGNSIQDEEEAIGFGGIMNSHRLTNSHHTELVNCLPLPSLPINYGARISELYLRNDDGPTLPLKALEEAHLMAQSWKIVELLRGTDIGYLCLRDGSHNPTSSGQGVGDNLEDEVLRIDPEAFSYTTPGPINRKGSRISAAEKKEKNQPSLFVTRSHGGAAPQVAAMQLCAGAPLDGQATLVTRKKRMTRKDKSRHGEVEQGVSLLEDSDESNYDVVSAFCGVLDELFQRTDAPGDDEGEEAGTFLALVEVKGVVEDVVKLRGKNDLQCLPVEYLLKLLTLLDRHVHRAHEKVVDDVGDVDAENTVVVLSALEAVHACLSIMADCGMPKQVYKEEIIDKIIGFTRYQIVHSIFPAYDPMYRQLHKCLGPQVDEDYEEMDEDPGDTAMVVGKKGRRKLKSSKSLRLGSIKVATAVSFVMHKLCTILALLRDLLSVARLPDSSVVQLTTAILSIFGVDNIQLLQLKAIGVACSIFSCYPQHRNLIIEECVSMFWKASVSRRQIRTYSLPDEDPKQVQMLTALLLQLVQCSVNLPARDGESELTAEAGSMLSAKCMDPAMDTCKQFWKLVLQRWAAPRSQDGIDVKGIVENIVVDLLTSLNSPEFPAASLMLQILCILLFSSAGLKSKDANVRGAAIELFGLIAARLKQDAVICGQDTLWIFSEVLDRKVTGHSEEICNNPSTYQGCVVCRGAKKGGKIVVSCAECTRIFHGDCIGLGGHDLLGRGWLCCCCLCKKQLVCFRNGSNSGAAARTSSFNLKHDVGGKSVEGVDEQRDVVGRFSIEGMAIIQQLLLNYLHEAGESDIAASFARRFYLCQWYRDDEAQGLETLDYHLRRLNSRPPGQEFGVAPAPLSRDVITRLSAVLGQQRPLAKGFDRILERLLASLQENSSVPRAKALRAVSALVEVDPGVLGDERVQLAVEGRFLDSAISVREAAMELVGRHIVRLPHVAEKYFEKLAERIMDTGVSVRKRVIKIIRDVCVANVGFRKSTDACVKIITRINDEESTIQDLVGRTFYELWFEEHVGHHSYQSADGSAVPIEIATSTQQLVDVLKSLPTNQPIVTIIKRSLSLDFAPQAAKTAATLAVSQAAIRGRCELMCRCLLESILKAEEASTEEPEIRALPYVSALHAFCMVDPTLCAPPSDPACFAVTLQPYLKTQVDNREVAQLLQSIVFVVDAVLPMLRRPPQTFVEELSKDLRQLIQRYSFQTVIHASIKCLCSLSKVTPKGVTSYEFLVRRFFRVLDGKRGGHFLGAEKANILRCLYCLGMLSRYCPDLVDCMSQEGISMQRVLDLLKDYLRLPEFDVKSKALQALGVFFIARPSFMLEKEIGKILEASLCASAESRLKLQTLRNFCDYLSDVEDQMGAHEAGKDRYNVVPVAAGAGDSNVGGGIIQLHWDLILERCLDMNNDVRLSALKVLEIVLRQGLVHPMSCVPQLVALEVDQQESTSKLAHRLVIHMNEKYPSFFESRLGDGLQLSFTFIQSGAAASTQDLSSIEHCPKVNEECSTAVSAKAGIARIYKLIRNTRVARNKFLGSILRKYDSVATGLPIIPFLVYCAEVIASLPFSLPEEPLYVIWSINRIVQVRGGALESSLKVTISEEPLGSVATKILAAMAAERVQEGVDAYDYITSSHDCKRSVAVGEEIGEISEGAIAKLKEECRAAIALALLLRLKRHLKIVYGLNDARCQAFMPTEHVKTGEALQRKENIREFCPRELPVASPTTIRGMLEQYQTFKRLLNEDAMDYSVYSVSSSKKRFRSGHCEAVSGAGASNGHPSHKTPKRKDATLVAVSDLETDGDAEVEDDDDQEWVEKKRKGGSGRGKGRSRRFM